VDLARDAGEVADQLDELVAPADEPENAVLVDNNARVVRWAGPGQRLQPIALAAGVELPLASVCLWLSFHTQQLGERRLVLLLRRGRKRRTRR
jgi:hypothetical protein